VVQPVRTAVAMSATTRIAVTASSFYSPNKFNRTARTFWNVSILYKTTNNYAILNFRNAFISSLPGL
jgi:hypothetical protein